MTRVEKINLAIEILHIQKNLKTPEIKEYFRKHNIYVDSEVIEDVIRALNYNPNKKINTKINRQWFFEMQDHLNPLLDILVGEVVYYHMTYEHMVRLLNELEIQKPIPIGGPWKQNTLRRYLMHRNLYRSLRRIRDAEKSLPYHEWCAKIGHVIAKLEEYSEWENTFRTEGSPKTRKRRQNDARRLMEGDTDEL
jgi:hypothetical protein